MNVFGVPHAKAGSSQIDSVRPLFGIASYIDIKQIESNHCGFDETLIIRTNYEAKVRILFKDLKIRELIQSQKSLSVEISQYDKASTQFSQSVFELRLYVSNIVRDLRELETIYNIVVYILDTLCDMESADEGPPNDMACHPE